MSEVLRLLRPRYPFVLLAVLFVSLGCAMQPPVDPGGSSGTNIAPPPPTLAGNPCAGGTGRKDNDRPIVCVDDSARELKAIPDVIRIHDVMSTDRSTPAAIQWFTTSGKGDLRVRFRNEDCVRNVVCTGGRCNAVAAKRLKPGEEVRCKYDVLLTGHPDLDPETVLTGCCVAPDP